MKIILASQSPFRKHALNVLGLTEGQDYQTVPSYFDENSIKEDNPNLLVQRLSEAKARSIGDRTEYNDSIIVAADLIVYNEKILGKPKDKEEARQMLKGLSGRRFQIITGLAVYRHSTSMLKSTSETCEVRFRKLSDFEIGDYVKNTDAEKCAGAFEDNGLLRFAEYIQGNYNFRTAIPVNKLVEFLREFGVEV